MERKSKKRGRRREAIIFILKKGALGVASRFNIKKTMIELKKLAREHGPYFLIYALLIELFEDIAVPAILCWVGKPHFIPAALAFHCEPIAYPLYFAVRSVARRIGA